MSKLLILVNHYNTLRIFRRELLEEISRQGNQIVVSMPECDEENKKLIESYGCKIIFTPLERRGMNPVKDIDLLFKYISLIKQINPDKVITYTIKPNIYGSIACKIEKKEHYVNITGLGTAFEAKGGMMRLFVSFLYKISLNKANKIFFENAGNRDVLVGEKIVQREQTVVMPGAGVNLTEFYKCSYPKETEKINFLFIGRIMKEKGVDELFLAIRRIKEKYENVVFEFVGWQEESYENEVKELESERMIIFHGFNPDIRPFIEKAHCIILPSWHEGMSNALLEAAAMCRPLITSNICGCKEAVTDGVSGYLTNVKDSQDIYNKIEKFINLPYQDKLAMGLEGRKLMESRFDKNLVVKRTMKEIGLGE